MDKDWPLHRRVISGGARMLARPLTPLSDPMSGFFGLPRTVYIAHKSKVNPIGYKIALELYVKCGCRAAAEVPINFGVRAHGESKLSSKVIVNYLQHLAALYPHRIPLAVLLAVPLLVLALLAYIFFVVFMA